MAPKMRDRRILAMLLVFIMIFSAAVTAYAAQTGMDENISMERDSSSDVSGEETAESVPEKLLPEGTPSDADLPFDKEDGKGEDDVSSDISTPSDSATSSDALRAVDFLEEKTAEVADIDSLIAAIDGAEDGVPVYIEVNQDIDVTKDIVIKSGKVIHFTGDGSLVRSASKNLYTSIITVNEGGELFLDGITVDGNKLGAGTDQMKEARPAINVTGKLVMADGALTGFTCCGIQVNGINASFHMKGGTINNNTAISAVLGMNKAEIILDGGEICNNTFGRNNDNRAGGVYVYNKAAFTMNGGKISNNDCSDSAAAVWAQGGALPAFLDTAGSFIMNGGQISGNKCNIQGSVMVGDFNPNGEDVAYFEMNGGLISENTSQYMGAGVSVSLNGKFVMNDGLIENNESPFGGGVGVDDGYISHNGEYLGYTHEQWQTEENCPGIFQMNGGAITNNYANENGGVGGGIYIASSNVILNEGIISGNTAASQGGGVYVGSVPYVLHTYDTVITGNEASILGGGIWSCPTGDVEVYANRGGAVFGNTASSSAAGDDFVAVARTSGYITTLEERMLGGGKADYYNDGEVLPNSGLLGRPDPAVPRFDPVNPGTPVIDINGSTERYALKAVVSDSAGALANENGRLLITGNTAPRGGGIGTNGKVVIGQKEDGWNLNVLKKWEGISANIIENKELTVNLKIGDYLLDSVVLNKGNSWTGSFRQLPDPDTLEGLKITVVEDSQEYNVSYSDTEIDDVTKTMSVTVTNSPLATGGLKISKTVSGGGASKSKEFSFTVSLSDNTINGTYGDLNFLNGVTSFTLKHGESKLAAGLPDGVSYTVTENDSGGYTVTATADTGVIAPGTMSHAVFDNYKSGGGGGSGSGSNSSGGSGNGGSPAAGQGGPGAENPAADTLTDNAGENMPEPDAGKEAPIPKMGDVSSSHPWPALSIIIMVSGIMLCFCVKRRRKVNE